MFAIFWVFRLSTRCKMFHSKITASLLALAKSMYYFCRSDWSPLGNTLFSMSCLFLKTFATVSFFFSDPTDYPWVTRHSLSLSPVLENFPDHACLCLFVCLISTVLTTEPIFNSWLYGSLQLFRQRLSEKVHATILKCIVGGFEFTVLQRNLKELARKAMKMCLRVLKESNKSRFDS